MSSKAANPAMRSAAWRISLWATLAFAIGTMLVFTMLHRFVSDDIQRRTDAWLSGEVEVLSEVARQTPKDRLNGRVVSEIAELASWEVPNRQSSSKVENDSVFFLQAGETGPARLWVGPGDGTATIAALRSLKSIVNAPSDLHVSGASVPFRVASVRMEDGSHIYLGLSERDELRVLRNLRIRFLTLWLSIVILGFVIVFYTTRRMLGQVREMTEAASRIGQSDLRSRVRNTRGNDEVGHLARTLNHMLDRIENTVHQLHAITDSLAHDLRSPLTAVRGRLETALSEDPRADQAESIVSAIDELDRLTEFLNKSLDVAEANADALRLSREAVDLHQLVRSMIDLYEPSMNERGLAVTLLSSGAVTILADPALLHRVVANLLDNELKHLPPCCSIWVTVATDGATVTLRIEDDGPGFQPELQQQLFTKRIKGRDSKGHGLGLSFVEAVVRVHGGQVTAGNRSEGGARLTLTLPLWEASESWPAQVLTLVDG
ncbi:signal transduction histidine kinase [Terriglobus roseus DSM 18391]|uniref:histidine kinase n=1 Tax=Terriglobus roseus (strain DSM 18391 / NRRL B-41598 / KBS 63) TaxID=926566 RepID=I3ZMH8_TERRK|nr:ATP-binding protein [Terriglobus roseus]AFL90446.1 signal transduction histidine kinase [Terriglobus roseus DSM 18391]